MQAFLYLAPRPGLEPGTHGLTSLALKLTQTLGIIGF